MRELRSIGISPDMIFARSDHPVNGELVEKIALFCDVEQQAVVPMVTADHLYEIPMLLEEQGVADYVLKRLGLKARQKPNWKELAENYQRNQTRKTQTQGCPGW